MASPTKACRSRHSDQRVRSVAETQNSVWVLMRRDIASREPAAPLHRFDLYGQILQACCPLRCARTGARRRGANRESKPEQMRSLALPPRPESDVFMNMFPPVSLLSKQYLWRGRGAEGGIMLILKQRR